MLIVFSLVMALSFGLLTSVEAKQGKIADFTLNDLTGKPVTISQLEGVVILDFWATWCPPCKVEIPYLQQLYDEYADKGLHIVGVSTESVAVQQKFIDQMRKQGIKMSYTFLVDPDGKVSKQYGIQGIPTTIFTNTNLDLIEKEVGFIPEYIDKFIKIVEANLPSKK